MQDKREEPSIHIANENIIQLVPPPSRPIWKYLAMLKLHIPPDPTISFLNTHPTHVHKMFKYVYWVPQLVEMIKNLKFLYQQRNDK